MEILSVNAGCTVCFCKEFQKIMLEVNLTKFTMLMSLKCIYTRTLVYCKIKICPWAIISENISSKWFLQHLWMSLKKILQRHLSKQHFSWLLQQWTDKKFLKVCSWSFVISWNTKHSPKKQYCWNTAPSHHHKYAAQKINDSIQIT